MRVSLSRMRPALRQLLRECPDAKLLLHKKKSINALTIEELCQELELHKVPIYDILKAIRRSMNQQWKDRLV